MKLYPDAALRYCNESTGARTRSSRQATLRLLAQLQARHPSKELHQYRTEDLTRFCLDGVAPGTSRHRRSKMMSFFGWCHYMKLIRLDPSRDLKFTVNVKAQPARANKWLTEEEATALLRTFGTEAIDKRNRLVFMFGLMMGLRRDAIASLRWPMFSDDLSRVTLTLKGGRVATLGVPPQLVEELTAWRAQTPDPDVILPWFTVEREPIWNKPMGSSNVYRITRKWGEMAPHDMRRTFAGILDGRGLPVKDISGLLCHSNVGTTDIYLKKNPNRAAALADAFRLEL